MSNNLAPTLMPDETWLDCFGFAKIDSERLMRVFNRAITNKRDKVSVAGPFIGKSVLSRLQLEGMYAAAEQSLKRACVDAGMTQIESIKIEERGNAFRFIVEGYK